MAKSVSSPVHPPALTGAAPETTSPRLPAADVAGSSPTRRRSAWVWLLDVTIWLALAAISYIPSFRTQPGMVAADTKQYLYLDPGRLIQSALSMWNPDVGAGTVTHQNIGYAFPMGPYYWPGPSARRPHVGRPALLDGHLVLRRRHRGPRARTAPRALESGPGGRRAHVHAHAVRDRLHRPHLGDRHALAALGWLLVFTVLACARGIGATPRCLPW